MEERIRGPLTLNYTNKDREKGGLKKYGRATTWRLLHLHLNKQFIYGSKEFGK